MGYWSGWSNVVFHWQIVLQDFGLLLLSLIQRHVCVGVSDKQTTAKAINPIELWKTC